VTESGSEAGDTADGTLPLHEDFSLRDPASALCESVANRAHHYDEQTKSVYVLRAEEVADMLVDPRLTSKRPKDRRLESVPPEYRPTQEQLKRFTSAWPIFLDGDLHRLVRAELVLGLQHASESDARMRLSQRVSALMECRRGREFDWVAEFAKPLSVAGIADLLHMTEQAAAPLVGHAAVVLDEMTTPLMLHDRAVAALAAVHELENWLAQSKDRSPSPLLVGLGRIWSAQEAGPLVATAALTQVITGALDPVVSLLAVLAERLTPELLEETGQTVLREELIRLASPFRFLPRYAVCPLQIGTHRIRAGERVVLGLATANLDPVKWDAPEEVAARGRVAHYAFGHGDHYCAGAAYCRTLARTVIEYMSKVGVTFQVSDCVREPELSLLRYRSLTGRLVEYRTC
jgi:cytochrome P450